MARQSKFTASFKAKVAVEALKETEPLESLAKKYGVAPSKITEWKNELLNNADKAFGKDTESKSELKKVTAEKDRLLKKVGSPPAPPSRAAAVYIHSETSRSPSFFANFPSSCAGSCRRLERCFPLPIIPDIPQDSSSMILICIYLSV